MTRDKLIEALKLGSELTNRGMGWWVTRPRKGYEARHSERVDDALVEELQKEGVIKVEVPYASSKATLI